jgi:hypothetical protein
MSSQKQNERSPQFSLELRRSVPILCDGKMSMTNQSHPEARASSEIPDVASAPSQVVYRHPLADDWVWNYFLSLREEAELAAHAAGGSLPPNAFTYGSNVEELPTLRETVPVLKEAEVGELQQILHELDTAFEKFFAGFGGYPSPHGPGRGPTPMAA